MVDKVRTREVERWEGSARIVSRLVVDAWVGVFASTYLGKTAEATWVRCLGGAPSASMRAASLSHLSVAGCVRNLRYTLRLR